MTGLPTPTERQLAAIRAPAGPVLLVAGPGSGKTFCLIARVRHLIERERIPPSRICAVTFTNKAAEAIAARLLAALGSVAEELTRGTLHRLCLGILREHVAEAGLRPGFGIADESYQRRLLGRLEVRPERARTMLGLFARHRLQGAPLAPGDAELLARYRAALAARNLVDFDEMIARAEALLRGHPAVAAELSRRWDALLVDEFQDLSPVQYAILRKLAAHRNLFAVGDDEQSIYSWAGADPRILERFQADFEVRPIVLEENRRCSARILEVARRLVGRNPPLFPKGLVAAERSSEHEVEARGFEDEAAEAAWIVADLLRDRAAAKLPWGEYAVLYRQHKVGQHLERELLRAGIPCRLARGQALLDDEAIGYVVSSLRVIRSPADPGALEELADRTLPPAMLEQVRAAAPRGADLLTSLRVFARRAPRGDPDRAKAWRFIYHVENLVALGRTHETLEQVVDELLGQRIARYRNPLEEHYAELSDPREVPGAEPLAARLAATVAAGGTVWLEPDRGVDVALAGLLRTGGVPRVARLTGPRAVRAGDLVLRSADAPPGRWPLVVFKALQLVHAADLRDRFRDYVAFDLETTDRDPAACDVVEIAAVRVRGGVIVEQFQELVRPSRPVSPAAAALHGYRDADLAGQPSFAEVWGSFRAFVGHDVLVAHNGQRFDVPVLRRLAAGLPGADDLVFYDTLPLARSLLAESARLEDLARRFGVAAGRSHHALDDASALVGVLRHLEELKLQRCRKAAVVQGLGHLGIALALGPGAEATVEERLLRELAVPAALGRYGDCLDAYAAEREAAPGDAPPVEEVIERLGGRRLMERLRAERPPAERYPAAVARLGALVAASRAPSLAESIDRFLELVALSTSREVEPDPGRVSLLTLHSTKGLEFSRVYIAGVEDAQLPGVGALREEREVEIQEARRLLYVGMTRAKDRLVLTRAARRDGRPAGGDLFLRDAGLQAPADDL